MPRTTSTSLPTVVWGLSLTASPVCSKGESLRLRRRTSRSSSSTRHCLRCSCCKPAALPSRSSRCGRGRIRRGRIGPWWRIGLLLVVGLWALVVFVLVPKQLGLPLSVLATGFPDLVYLLVASALVALVWAVVKAGRPTPPFAESEPHRWQRPRASASGTINARSRWARLRRLGLTKTAGGAKSRTRNDDGQLRCPAAAGSCSERRSAMTQNGQGAPLLGVAASSYHPTSKRPRGNRAGIAAAAGSLAASESSGSWRWRRSTGRRDLDHRHGNLLERSRGQVVRVRRVNDRGRDAGSLRCHS